MNFRKLFFKYLVNCYPPFLGAGIHITAMAEDKTWVEVELRSTFYNKNYVGTQFGGSLYAMTDPFFMLILIENLGPNYIVWDKAANIRFKSPGRSKIKARFEIPREEIEKIRQQADDQDKVEPAFHVKLLDESGKTVAEVDKILWVKRKDKFKN